MVSLPVYPKLPHMQCDVGCGKCCGPVICNSGEMAAIKQYIADNGIVPLRQGITCPFYQAGTCAIYPMRPWICRVFGHTPKLVCANGHNVNVPERRERKIAMEYAAAGGTPDQWLHAFAYTDDEFREILQNELEEAVLGGRKAP